MGELGDFYPQRKGGIFKITGLFSISIVAEKIIIILFSKPPILLKGKTKGTTVGTNFLTKVFKTGGPKTIFKESIFLGKSLPLFKFIFLEVFFISSQWGIFLSKEKIWGEYASTLKRAHVFKPTGGVKKFGAF